MSREIYAAFGRVLPEQIGLLDEDVRSLGQVAGFVFLDPEDGVHPLHLAHRVLQCLPQTSVVLPLVSRDANRTALLSEARAAQALGARGVLLLAGHLDRSNPAKAVYDVDPLQMLCLLNDSRLGLDVWVASRCSTSAEQARVRSLAQAGARRCLVPWEGEDDRPRTAPLTQVFCLEEAQWSEGRSPADTGHLLLHITPGQGRAAVAPVTALRGETP